MATFPPIHKAENDRSSSYFFPREMSGIFLMTAKRRWVACAAGMNALVGDRCRVFFPNVREDEGNFFLAPRKSEILSRTLTIFQPFPGLLLFNFADQGARVVTFLFRDPGMNAISKLCRTSSYLRCAAFPSTELRCKSQPSLSTLH